MMMTWSHRNVPGETFYLIISLLHFHTSIKLYIIILDTFFFLYIYHQFMLIFFAFENDTESLKLPKQNFFLITSIVATFIVELWSTAA